MSTFTANDKTLTPASLTRLFTSLQMVFDSGLLLTEGFEVLAEAAENNHERELFEQLSESCAEGSRLSEAFLALGCLPQYALGLIQVAEQTGTLSETCQALAVYYEKRDQLAQSIRSALVYPLAMLFMIFIVVVMLLTQAMPVFDQILAQLGYEMSGLASAFLAAGVWLKRAALGLSTLAVVLVVLVLLLRLTVAGRGFFAWLFEHNPLTKELSFNLSLQRLLLGYAAMLRSGMAPLDGIELAGALVDDSRVRQRLQLMGDHLREGSSFQSAMVDSALLPKSSQLLVAIGFRTGNNAEAFERIGENIATGTEQRLASLVSAIEPTLVAVMTVIVGIVLLSVMLPLLGILATI